MAASPFLTAYATADGFGKCIFLALFALSIVSWIVLLHKFWLMKKVRFQAQQFAAFVRDHKENFLHLKPSNIPKFEEHIPTPFVSIFKLLKAKTKELLEKNQFFTNTHKNEPVHLSRSDLETVKNAMDAEIRQGCKELGKNLYILSTVVTLAPFLGLLGTVWGILVAFSELQAGASIGSSTALLGGLSTALTTTVIGLLIAIPALIAHSFLKNAIRDFASEMEHFGHLLISHIELQYRQVDLHQR